MTPGSFAQANGGDLRSAREHFRSFARPVTTTLPALAMTVAGAIGAARITLQFNISRDIGAREPRATYRQPQCHPHREKGSSYYPFYRCSLSAQRLVYPAPSISCSLSARIVS
jgi:hypothetical protein